MIALKDHVAYRASRQFTACAVGGSSLSQLGQPSSASLAVVQPCFQRFFSVTTDTGIGNNGDASNSDTEPQVARRVFVKKIGSKSCTESLMLGLMHHFRRIYPRAAPSTCLPCQPSCWSTAHVRSPSSAARCNLMQTSDSSSLLARTTIPWASSSIQETSY